MKPIRSMVGVMAAALLAFVLTGCGPKGGTLTLVNESSYLLTNPTISLGDGSELSLAPGQWMRSNVDKNIAGATVKFTVKQEEQDKIDMSPHTGNWAALNHRWTSSLIGVQNGESVVVTVRNKKD